MTDYTTLDLNTLLPGEPWTSGKALAVYENPIAIAEGAAGAPRIKGRALDLYLANEAWSTSGVAIIDLDGFQALRLSGVGGADAARLIEGRYSADNGSTWGAWQTFINPGDGAVAGSAGRSFTVEIFVNLQTGLYSAIVVVIVTTSSSEDELKFNRVTGTHTVPSDANAIEFRVSAATGGGFTVFAAGTFG
jgi:hypothetical protein